MTPDPFWIHVPIQSDLEFEIGELARIVARGEKRYREAHNDERTAWPTGRVRYEAAGNAVVAKYEWSFAK